MDMNYTVGRCPGCNKYMDRCVCGKVKGQKHGLCNRTACQSPHNVIFFHHSNKAYYCPSCAHELNDDMFNARDAQRLYNHELLTLDAADLWAKQAEADAIETTKTEDTE